MPQVTLRDLNEWIDLKSEEESARLAFESQHRRRRSFTDWLINLMPVFVFCATLAFYFLSAPHTVALLDKITPGFGWVSPVGIELLIVVLSGVRQLKWRTIETFLFLYGLLVTAIVINIAGGFISVLSQSQGIEDMPFDKLLGLFPTLPATSQVVFILVPLIGFLIPVAGKFTGAFVIKMAMGEIKFELVSLDDLWIKQRASLMKSALMRAAMKRGAGAKTAGVWAHRIIEQMYEIEDDVPVIAMSGTVPAVPSFPKVQTEMGFGGMVQAQKDTQNTEDNRTKPHVLNSKMVERWIDDNPDRVQELIMQPGARRNISRAISQEIAGDSSGYKTVERMLKAKGYEL